MQNFKNRSVQTCAQNAGSNDFKDIWDSAISSRSLNISQTLSIKNDCKSHKAVT